MTDYKVIKAIRNGCEYDIGSSSGGASSVGIDAFVLGGGGSGSGGGGGGGGAGGLIIYSCYPTLTDYNYKVTIGQGGFDCGYYRNDGGDGYDSCFGGIIGYGGGGGGATTGRDGGSGGGAGISNCCGYSYNGGSSKTCMESCPIILQGFQGGGANYNANCCYIGGGGGGAGGAGSNGNIGAGCRGKGGLGITSNFSGESLSYAGGGGGYWCGTGQCGGGNGTVCECSKSLRNATTYGSGGGGTSAACYSGCGGDGCQGIVMLKYPIECGYNVKGGYKYLCNGECIHSFTSSGIFTITKGINKKVNALIIGGGGGGSRCTGGGGGEVVCGTLLYKCPMNITIGGAGTGRCLCGDNGGDTYVCTGIGDIVSKGGLGGNHITDGHQGGHSGNGHHPGIQSWAGVCMGGGGAGGPAGRGETSVCYVNGGIGLYGYGGGGAGAYCSTSGTGVDGGGNAWSNATGCGGGGGVGCYKGAAGMVEICYPTDGSSGIHSATGGDSCYTCDGYCVHRFTTDGTFTVVN